MRERERALPISPDAIQPSPLCTQRCIRSSVSVSAVRYLYPWFSISIRVAVYTVQCQYRYPWFSISICGSISVYMVQCQYPWFGISIRVSVSVYTVWCQYWYLWFGIGTRGLGSSIHGSVSTFWSLEHSIQYPLSIPILDPD